MATVKQLDSRRSTIHSGVVAITSLMAAAAKYASAAKGDERHGLPCTAAMEWRKAADILAPLPQLADRCWREWERLMRLPRHLAMPIALDESVPVRSGPQAASDTPRFCAAA